VYMTHVSLPSIRVPMTSNFMLPASNFSTALATA
jgi:hypothetical protein